MFSTARIFRPLFLTALTVVMTTVAANLASGQEVQFVEKFAVADDRGAVLDQLIPGTQEYYYFMSLHYQNTGQLDEVEKLLEPWIKRYGRSLQVQQIQNRQALLSYDDDPTASLEYIKNELKLTFDHQREIPEADKNLASRLDPELIDVEKLIDDNLLLQPNTTLFADAALPLIGGRIQTHTRLADLLSRVRWPDFPNLVDLIVEELSHKSSRGFGNYKIHNRLTLEQLRQLQEKLPRLKNDSRMVNLYLKKLRPSDDLDWTHDPELQAEYLERLWDYVENLHPAHNSLKACIRYHQLLVDQKRDRYDREKFISYIKLPRNAVYVNEDFLKRQKEKKAHFVTFNVNFSEQIQLIPISNDEQLITDYLQQLLTKPADLNEFSPYIKSEFLKKQWATTNILRGTGDVEQWASLLSPEQYKSLVERVDLEFDATNPTLFKADDPVKLKLHTKNIDKLIVKIFEINSENYYRRFGKEIDTRLNLDGLVPNETLTFEYDEPSVKRVARKFDFENLNDRGVYVIDFIGNGKSSRAIIRKGQYSALKSITALGHEFAIIDEEGEPVNGAELLIGGQLYTASKDEEDNLTNKILVPFSTQPSMENVIIRKGDFCSLENFQHSNETYTLTAGLHVDRESLLRARSSQVVIRPQLRLSGTPIPAGILENVQLQITTTDLDGDTATTTKSDIELSETGESIVEFQVPPRLSSITFQLKGDLKSLSTAKRVNTVSAHAVTINRIDQSDEIQDVHLLRSGADYLLEVRGKSGENRPNQAVALQLKSRFLKNPIKTNLQSNSEGVVELGDLAGIDWITARCAAGSKRSWQLEPDGQTRYLSVHAVAGETVRVVAPPGLRDANRGQIGLFQLGAGTIVRDAFDSIVVKDGLVGLKDLSAGNYQLVFKDSKAVTTIRVTEGKRVDTTILGSARRLETRAEVPLHIRKLDGEDELKVNLGGITPTTRVHVFATRYQPRFNPLAQFDQIRNLEPAVIRPGIRRTTFMAGRKIGDEYQYILDRRYARKFVGNMLERPSLLLNPLAIENANNQMENLQGQSQFGNAADQKVSEMQRSNPGKSAKSDYQDFANLDFLKNSSLVLANLKPDEDGVVTIDPEKLGNKQHLVIVAVDMYSTVQRSFALPAKKPETRDLRLANGFDPESNVSQSKQTEVLVAGKEFVIDDVAVAKFQSFDDLGDIYLVLEALKPNPHMSKFRFVLQWPNKTQEQKQSLYSQYACHELNFFIYKKDKPFFKSVVKPYIENKREKTFLDHYLLGADLTDYLEPSAFTTLNAVERILLSQRLENRRGDLLKHLNELYRLRPTSRTYAGKLYDSTVAAGTIIDGNSSIDKGVLDSLRGVNKSLPSLASQWSEHQTRSLTTMQTETRTRMVPVTKTRTETRTRNVTLEDGSIVQQQYSVSVPYTEQVSQNYTVQVPRQGKLAYDYDPTVISSPNAILPPAPLDFQASSTKDRGVGDDFNTNGIVLGGTGGTTLNRPAEFLSGGEISIRELEKFYEQTEFDEDGEDEEGEMEPARKRSLTADRLYVRSGSTQVSIEQHYYQQRLASQNFLLAPMNRFWRDYATHENGTFISTHFAEAHSSFTEMMFALSVLDLPFEAAEHKIQYVESEMRLTPGSPMIAMHQQMRPAIVERRNTTVLVSENFYRKDDRYRYENEMRFDKFVSDRFSAHTVYGGQVVLTNPTSSPRTVEVLIQVPHGSVAISKSKQTQTIDVSLDAFSTQSFEYSFYFPTAGEFSHFPAHVASNGKVVAIADQTAFVVDDKPAELDKTSWQYVSQNGSDKEVIEFLNHENVLRLDLTKIAFRMKNADFFKEVMQVLGNRYTYNSTLWSYSIMHDEIEAINEFLQQQGVFVSNCGMRLDSTPLTIEPVKRRWYQHWDFSPLINARAHRVGRERTILNQKLHSHYHQLMLIFACQADLDSEDRLALTYYMLLQDRIEEAIAQFDQVDKSDIAEQLQYDYCDAYINMYLEKPDQAEAIAKAHAEHPVDRWRSRFKTVLAHVAETRGEAPTTIDPDNRTESQTELASKAASFDFTIESGTVEVNYQNLDQLSVNYYQMDIELLFSRNPFARTSGDGFSLIRPNDSQVIELDDSGKMSFEIPQELRNKNVTVELTSRDQSKSQAYFAHSMAIQLIENYGQLKVTGKEEGEALPKTYVKVYAQHANGRITFYKDGYTDLRGRFDYATQSNSTLDGVARFAILVMSEEHGTSVRQASPPME